MVEGAENDSHATVVATTDVDTCMQASNLLPAKKVPNYAIDAASHSVRPLCVQRVKLRSGGLPAIKKLLRGIEQELLGRTRDEPAPRYSSSAM